MKAAVLHAPGEIRIEERDRPTPGPREVLVQITAVGVCGSDVHYYEHGRIGPFIVEAPLILGHESAGRVVELGEGASKHAVGDRVTLEPGVPCGRCRECRAGRYNLCPDVVFFATPPVDGAFAEFVPIHEDFAFALPDELSDEEGALMEPLSVGVWACRKAGVTAGDKVLVTGAGPIGQLAMQTRDRVRRDPRDGLRRQPVPARARRAAPARPRTAGPDDDLGDDFDALIECSGHPDALTAGIKALRPAGTAVLVGMGPGEEGTLPLSVIQCREIWVTGTFRYANTYPTAIALAATGRVDLKAIMSRPLRARRGGRRAARRPRGPRERQADGAAVRAAIWEKPGELVIGERDDPTPGHGELVVKVGACGMCGTDLHIADGAFAPTPYPIIPGHEFAGEIVAVGPSVEGWSEGDRVACRPVAVLRPLRDVPDRARQPVRELVGDRRPRRRRLRRVRESPGRERLRAARRARLPHRRADRAGLLRRARHAPPAGPAGRERARDRRGHDGPAARAADPARGRQQVAVVDTNEGKLPLAEKLGADAVATSTEDLGNFDVAVDATGAAPAIESAFDALKRGGRLMVFGVAHGDAKISLSPFRIYNDEITVLGSMAVLHSLRARARPDGGGRDRREGDAHPRLPARQFADALANVREGRGVKSQVLPQT